MKQVGELEFEYAGEEVPSLPLVAGSNVTREGAKVPLAATLKVPQHVRPARFTIRVVPMRAWLTLDRVTLIDSTGRSFPQSLGACPIPGSDPSVTDSDSDGFTDADEVSNGTDPCSASSRPPDFDNDRVSDLNDADDDNDGIPDVTDQLFFDANNGASTTLQWGASGDSPVSAPAF